jgi:hypothetical protein
MQIQRHGATEVAVVTHDINTSSALYTLDPSGSYAPYMGGGAHDGGRGGRTGRGGRDNGRGGRCNGGRGAKI